MDPKHFKILTNCLNYQRENGIVDKCSENAVFSAQNIPNMEVVTGICLVEDLSISKNPFPLVHCWVKHYGCMEHEITGKFR